MSFTDQQIRDLFNASRDGTATDAIIRHTCRVALAELCIGDDTSPAKVRYPTADEISDARSRCADMIRRRARLA